ncbi:hypothetical protein STENM327S_00458 [Streptomyces tendae]
MSSARPSSVKDAKSRISAGPNVDAFRCPIFSPVQPFSLWLAVAVATQGTSRANCAW